MEGRQGWEGTEQREGREGWEEREKTGTKKKNEKKG